MVECQKCGKHYLYPAYSYRWNIIEERGDGGKVMKRGDVLYPVCPYCLEGLEVE